MVGVRPRSIARWLGRGEDDVADRVGRMRAEIGAIRSRLGPRSSDTTARETWPSPPTLEPGVNVIGYLQHQVGLGNIARRLCSVLIRHGVATSPIAFDGTLAPLTPDAFVAPQRMDHTTSIVVLAADQLAVLDAWYPDVAARTRTIGYCFWELDVLPPSQIAGARLVDEIWVPTRFTLDAFSKVDGLTVRHVPIPVAEPAPSDRPREAFEALAGAGDRVVFGVTFDHFSSVERKNPIGAIDAYCRAFEDDGRHLLVVKTLNADHLPLAHARLVEHACGRTDVVVWDEHLSRADQLAFIAHLDVLVSLHRGEGLGLHLAEAMWLGVPVIATGYSGNLDFMDDSCSRLVRHSMIDVGARALHYPGEAQWADPDLDHAASLMRDLTDPVLRAEIGAAGRVRMESQPDDATTAAHIASLVDLGCPVSDTPER